MSARAVGSSTDKRLFLIHDGNRYIALSEDEQRNMYEMVHGLKQRVENSHLNLITEEFYKQMGHDCIHHDQRSMAIMNQTDHILPHGYR